MAMATVYRFLGGVLAGTIVTSALVGGVSTAAVANVAPDCSPITVLAFRGSGEGNLDPQATASAGAAHAYGTTGLITNGWEGPTLERLIAQLAPQAAAASIPVIGVGASDSVYVPGYPAAPVGPTDLIGIAESAQTGAIAAELIIKQAKSAAIVNHCAFSPRFIAVGYSQGAIAARVLAQLNSTDVVGVVTIGDPAQKPSAAGNVGAGAAGDGLMRWLVPSFGDKFDALYAQDTVTAALCHAGDPVCDFGWTSVWRVPSQRYENHAYFVSIDDIAPATQALAALTTNAQLNPVVALQAAAPVAHAAASVLAFEGRLTTISAVGTESADASLNYEFDYDNDGHYDADNPVGLVAADIPVGIHTVKVRVTDGADRSDVVSLTFEVAPATAATPKADLNNMSFLVSELGSIAAGSVLPLELQGAPTGSELTMMLVPKVSPSPWGAEPAFSTVLTAGGESDGVQIPGDLATGAYFVVVGAESGEWGAVELEIVAASVDPGTDPGTDPGIDPAQTGGLLAPVTPITVPAVGQAILTVDGTPGTVTVARATGISGLTISGVGFALTVNGLHHGGSAIPVDANNVLVLERDGSVTVSGTGFAPNTDVEVFLFSTATAVGSATVNAAGAFSATFAVPASMSAGLHTLQLVGLAPNGSTRVVDLGVRVADAAASALTLAKTGIDLGGVLGSALLVVLAGLAVAVRPRRRTVTAA
ncbi:cutinase family protein [Cryobacterium sp. PH29-G1]|uniref:cutinase family protein n=1 Tax=Cryobacterium sp. PH29-G1 TaxID=3046211 RepID=UPI0024BAF1F8|nr:cutinase family protein [Cryobacterium sp. PH29-G1]MDJ0347950.1 cutinase family protein [Cryobacterium sp. PH29-G1]